MPKQSRYGPNRCNAQCCESSDCLLSFSEGGECYAVSNPHAARNMTMHHLKPRIGVQIAIIDRNKEVSRSLDDEDEDPDELGSDEVYDQNFNATTEPTKLKSQAKMENFVRSSSWVKTNPRWLHNPNVSLALRSPKSKKASENASKPSRSNKVEYSTNSLKQTANMKDHVNSSLSKTNDILHDTASVHSNTSSSHSISKKTGSHSTKKAGKTFKLLDAVHKVSSKVKAMMPEMPSQVKWSVDDEGEGFQKIRFQGNKKPLKKAITAKNKSKGLAHGKMDVRGSFKNSHSHQSWNISSKHFSEPRVEEGSSRNNEIGDEVIAGNDAKGESGFSGRSPPKRFYHDASVINSKESSDNRAKEASGHTESSGDVHEDWSAANENFSGEGDNSWNGAVMHFSGQEVNANGQGESDRNGYLHRGEFRGVKEINRSSIQPTNRKPGHRVGDGKMSVHLGSKLWEFEDSTKSRQENRTHSKTLTLKNRKAESKAENTHHLDVNKGAKTNGDDNETSRRIVDFSPKTSLVKAEKHRNNSRSFKKSAKTNKLDVVTNESAVGSDDYDNKVASLPREAVLVKPDPGKHYEGSRQDRVVHKGKSEVRQNTSSETHKKRIDNTTSFESHNSSVISANVANSPQTTDTSGAKMQSQNVHPKRRKFNVKKTRSSNFEQHKDKIGSNKSNTKTPSTNVRFLEKFNPNLRATGHVNETKIGNVKLIGEAMKKKAIPLEDPDELGSDDEDATNEDNRTYHGVKRTSSQNASLYHKPSTDKSIVSKDKKRGENEGKKQVTTKKKGKVAKKIDLNKNRDGQNITMKNELRAIKFGKYFSQGSSITNITSNAKKTQSNRKAVPLKTSPHESNGGTNESKTLRERVKATTNVSPRLSLSWKNVLNVTTAKERKTNSSMSTGKHVKPFKATVMVVRKLSKMSGHTKNRNARAHTILNKGSAGEFAVKRRKIKEKPTGKGKKLSSTKLELKHNVTKAKEKTILSPEFMGKSKKSERLSTSGSYDIADQYKKSHESHRKQTNQKQRISFKTMRGHEPRNHVKSAKRTKKLRSSKLKSNLEEKDDLMKYAHPNVPTYKLEGGKYLANSIPITKPEKAISRKLRKNKRIHAKKTQTKLGVPSLVNATKKWHVIQKPNSFHRNRKPTPPSFVKKSRQFQTTRSTWPLQTSVGQIWQKRRQSLAHHPVLLPAVRIVGVSGSSSSGKKNTLNGSVVPMKLRKNSNIVNAKAQFLSHFHKDGNGTEVVELSVKSGGKQRHKGRHSKHINSIDVEDLGDADFDIMMSNDIPHRDFPKKVKKKWKDYEHGNIEHKSSQTENKDDEVEEESETSLEDEKGENKPQTLSKTSNKQKVKEIYKHRHGHRKIEDDDVEHSSEKEEKKSSKQKGSKSRKVNKYKLPKVRRKDRIIGRHHKKHRHETLVIENDRTDAVDSNKDNAARHITMHHGVRKHNRHEKRRRKYKDNNWRGKIIPGEVKFTYEEKKKRKENHQKRKHYVKEQKKRKKERGAIKIHSHENHKSFVYKDGHRRKEKHPRHHKGRQEKAQREKNEEHNDPDEGSYSNYERRKTYDHKLHEGFDEKKDFKSRRKQSKHQKSKDKGEKEQTEASGGSDMEDKQERAEKGNGMNYKEVEIGRQRLHSQFHRKQKYEKYEKQKHHEYDAEKSTEVNYEVETGKHRIFQDNRETGEYEERHNGGNTHKHYENSDVDVTSSKSKDDNREYGYDERHGDDDSGKRREEDNGDEKEEPYSEVRTENRVVLGQDSEREGDNDDEKNPERNERHHWQGHEYRRKESEENGEIKTSESARVGDSLQRHSSVVHHHFHHHRNTKFYHMHHDESYGDSEESQEGDNEEKQDKRRNFRKSLTYHRKVDRDHEQLTPKYDSTRNREEEDQFRENHDNPEYHREDNDHDFHATEDQHHANYKHRHRHSKPRVENERNEENFEDRHGPGRVGHHHETRHKKKGHFFKYHKKYEGALNKKSHHYAEESPRHHEIMEQRLSDESENDDENVSLEKEADDGGTRDYEQARWKIPEDHGRNFQESTRAHQYGHHYDHHNFGDHTTTNRFEPRPKLRKYHKFNPSRKNQELRQNRHYFQDDYEDSGGIFDASSSNHAESSDNDRFYGGEGNQKGRKHRMKDWKHKHGKDRQSDDYWSYGSKNPHYYRFGFHEKRHPFVNRFQQPTPAIDWQATQKNDGGWISAPRDWYLGIKDRDQAPWPQYPSQQQFHTSKPTRYRWAKYNLNDDENSNDYAYLPHPTPIFKNPFNFFRPTSPSWRRPGLPWSSFLRNGDPGKLYQEWFQHILSGAMSMNKSDFRAGPLPFEAQAHTQAVIPEKGRQIQPTGAQSKYVPPFSLQVPSGDMTRFHPTVRRQYPATPVSEALKPTNATLIKNIMNNLSTPPSVSGGKKQGITPLSPQNKSISQNIAQKINLTSVDQERDRNRLNGFFKEEGGGKKSVIERPANKSQGIPANNSSIANPQQNPPKTTVSPKTTQAAILTTAGRTLPVQNVTKANQYAKSTTAAPTRPSTPATTPTAPNFGDDPQMDDSSATGKKHRKHRAPVCIAGKTTDDLTLLRGKKAGNFTNIGDVGDFEMCIKRCCQKAACDVAFKSTETCFLVSCFSTESCQTAPALDDIFSPQMSFVKRNSQEKDNGQDEDDEWNDKISPSGIHEVCEAEKTFGILWKKTVAGDYSTHPCPRGAKGLVKRRCEADSRWLPPDFGNCVSSDYQSLYDKSRNLAVGADPSPLIRELSQLTTQNIDNSLIFGGDLDRATDIMAAIVQHNGQTDSQDMTRQDVENFVKASSNLLDMTNQQEWFNMQKNKPGSADVLRSMEMFALQAARRLSRDDMMDPTITNNIVIKMDRKSPGDGGLTFPDFSNPKIDRWDARHDIIALPSSIFNQETSTASISFKSLPYLLPDSNVSAGVGPNSKVISTVMHPHPHGKITPPVTVVLSHIKRRRGNPKCVFWDYTLNPHKGGAWSTRGCWLAFSNQSHSICQCSHLSNFAVLMDLSSDESLQKEQKRERTMALMWIGIPVLIVGVIGGLYMSFTWNRKSGISSTVTMPSSSLNEKTGLLGQRVVTSQIREEFPASPSRDLYRALSPGYSPTGDLEWQDEFDFDVASGDQRFKQMLLPKLQLLQNQLITEFYDMEKREAKKKLLVEGIFEIQQKAKTTRESVTHSELFSFQDIEMVQPQTQIKIDNPLNNGAVSLKTPNKKLKSVRFADDCPSGLNHTDEDKEHFRWLQKMERRVFAQHLSRWKANSHLDLCTE
ncbi:uncharacterized protein LOC114975600 isoform X2 [Acropora millepora]|nr:uncharacterized protein LOC114975600 isoform X2 [Acropora millepora]